ncbi:hypothetical protein, partial [Klebsiella pneumoniae]|uniref:hypothetical protein n=1 Tax=Klebsiella pneumoniae TaxID=573 RepID=UPI003EE1328C
MKLLPFLKSIPQDKLYGKNYTILSLLKAAKAEIIDEYFESFKIATEKFLNDDINIELAQLYQLISKISAAGYRSFLVKQIIEYVIENND